MSMRVLSRVGAHELTPEEVDLVRGAGHTVSRITIDLGNTALYNAAAEFWPDIHRKLQHMWSHKH